MRIFLQALSYEFQRKAHANIILSVFKEIQKIGLKKKECGYMQDTTYLMIHWLILKEIIKLA